MRVARQPSPSLSLRRLGLAALAVALVTMGPGLTACFDDPIRPEPSEPVYSLADLPEDSIKDVPEVVAIARQVPSFAGMYFDDQGRLVVAMTDVNQRGLVEPLLRQQLGIHETRAGQRAGPTVAVVTRQVQYSFLELARFKTALGRAFAIRGVATLDANEEQNRVRIGLADPTVQSRVRALADSLRIPQGNLCTGSRSYSRLRLTA